MSGWFKYQLFSPFSFPAYLHALILPIPPLPDNQTPYWSPCLCSALCESIQKVMFLELRSEPSVALCSRFKGFECVYKVVVWLQLLSWLCPGESSNTELHCAVSRTSACSVVRSPTPSLAKSCSARGHARHPLYLEVFPASLEAGLPFLGSLPLIRVTVCIPLPFGDHFCVFLGPNRLCFP